MEVARAASSKVTEPFDIMPLLHAAGAKVFETTKNVPLEQKERMTDYMLGPTGGGPRFVLDPYLVRSAWVRACCMATKSTYISDVLPLLRCGNGCLVSSRYPEVFEASFVRVRLALDFDATPNSKEFDFPDPDIIFQRTCKFLQQNTTCDDDVTFANEDATVLIGSNDVKERSVHLIFHNLCLSPIAANKIKNGDGLCDDFTAAIGLGLCADLGIQGLKWTFMDKPTKGGGWRKSVLPITKHFNCEYTEISTWRDLGDRLDPHMLRDDSGWQRMVTWKSKTKKAKVSHNKIVRSVSSIIGTVSGNAEAKVRAAFPGFFPDNVVFESKEGGIFVPKTTLCPLKDGNHGSAGKFYIFEHSDGTVECKCHNSNCMAIVIKKPIKVMFPIIINDVAKVWIRVGTQALLRASLYHPFSSAVMYTREKCNQHSSSIALNSEGAVSINRKEFTPVQYWFDSTPESYDQCTFAPPPQKCPPQFFNTYCGLNLDVTRIADTMTEFTEEQLMAEWEVTRNHIFTNLCNNNEEASWQLIGFFADMQINPGRKPKWSICLHGPQGAGKGLAMAFFSAICGDRLYCHADHKSMTEDFNGGMMEKLLVYSDEGIDTKSGDGYLKKLITEEKQSVRRKYQDSYDINTCFRIVAACNEEPTWIKPGDRRWLVLYCDTRTKADDGSVYLPNNEIAAETTSSRGPAAFYEMARRGLLTRAFNPMETIATDDKMELVVMALEPMDAWWRNTLRSLDPDLFCDKYVSKQEVFNKFYDTLGERDRVKFKLITFWRRAMQMVPKDEWNEVRKVITPGTNAVHCIKFPSAITLREGFCHLHKIAITTFDDLPLIE